MAVLSAAVAVIGVVTLFNLFLVYGVIRRLRSRSATEQNAPASSIPGLDLRFAAQPFAAVAVDGTQVSAASLAPGTPVGFFAAGCAPCEELMPRFVAAVRDFGGDALAIVADGPGRDQYVAELSTAATVLTGDDGQAAIRAFGVQSFPTLCRVGQGGTIQELRTDLTDLRDVVRA